MSDANGLICFLSPTRFCNASCMAYAPVPEGPDYRDQQWANCLLLVSAHRTGKHLAILAAQGAELLKKAKNEAADRARTAQPPPPVVK